MQKTSATKKYWVAKFGGTSVATHAAMARCVSVVMNHPDVRVIVVSAPSGVTDLLVKLSQSNQLELDIKPLVNEIKTKIHAIMADITPNQLLPTLRLEIETMLSDIESFALTLKNQYSRSDADALLSYGERLSARLFTCVLQELGLGAAYQDARTLIKTNNSFGKAEVLINETEKQVNELLLPKCEKSIVVTEGFIGSTLDNLTTTLGRGGSDYSAAILAEAMRADVLQIWTDVPGIYTVDPRLVTHATPIDEMSFTEAAELAQFGAKVLHPATLWPAIRKNIPVFVGSSINSKAQGTWIRAKNDERHNAPLIRAISLRRHQSLLTINSLEMLHTHGFLANIFTILAKHQLSVDIVTTSEVSVALTLNHPGTGPNDLLTPDILSELKSISNISLTIDNELCLIALVGNQLHITSGISGKVFKRLADFNIRLICHGASSHNLCFLVNEKDADAVIQALHAEFFS